MTGRGHPALWALLAMLVAQGALDEGSGLHGQVPDSTVSVRGRVLEHETGRPLEGASVSLAPTSDDLPRVETRISGEDGAFVFSALAPGLYHLSATLLGYTELRDTLRVAADSEVSLTLPLSSSPLPLEPIVVVVARHPVGPLQAFERRRSAQRGTFLTREDIERSNSQEFTDLLRPLPGIRLVPTATFGNTVYFRGGCTPDLWMDGTHVGTTTDIDTFLHPEDLEAVEIYRGPELPGEFGTNLCGAIVAWTKRGPAAGSAGGRNSIARQLMMAGGIVLTMIGIRMIG